MSLTIRTFAATSLFALAALVASPAQAGGGMADCVDANDSCQVCADEQCPTETQACCDAQGCKPLVVCVIDNCASALGGTTNDLINCAATNCLTEVIAAGGQNGPGTQAAIGLGDCLADPLQNPPAGACSDCVDSVGLGGSGGTPTTVGAGGAMGQGGSGTGGVPGAGGTTTGGPGDTSGGSSAGGASASADDDGAEEDSGCGCAVVGDPAQDVAPIAAFAALAGLVFARRRRR